MLNVLYDDMSAGVLAARHAKTWLDVIVIGRRSLFLTLRLGS
jgi:hypothetical protein